MVRARPAARLLPLAACAGHSFELGGRRVRGTMVPMLLGWQQQTSARAPVNHPRRHRKIPVACDVRCAALPPCRHGRGMQIFMASLRGSEAGNLPSSCLGYCGAARPQPPAPSSKIHVPQHGPHLHGQHAAQRSWHFVLQLFGCGGLGQRQVCTALAKLHSKVPWVGGGREFMWLP